MVLAISEFHEPKVHDAVTPKSLAIPNPELQNAEILKSPSFYCYVHKGIIPPELRDLE
jgi:hypothetical protein